MKKVYKLLFALLIIAFINRVAAAPVNTSFTDDQFYNCIIVKLNTDGYDGSYDRDATTHNVTKEELASITVLKCNESNIENVKGIELLTNLTDLNLSDNNISSINLASNTKITNLLLSNNKLSSIDLSKNTVIANLYLDGNKLSSVNLSNNRNLLVLNINNNKFTSLDLTNNDKLIDLKANTNAFAAINKVVYKDGSINLDSIIKFAAENETIQGWLNPTWSTKNANVASVNQKGTVKGIAGGSVNVVASVEDVYSITYNIKVSEISSETYNIDDQNETITVDNANIKTILGNINVANGEAMIYNTSNKYVTSGNITSGFKLKVMQDAQVLKTYTLNLVQAIINNDLESLEVKDYTIDFDKDKTNYTIIVGKDVEKVEVIAKAVEESASIKIEGNEALVDGTNTVTITVTGKDNTTKTYTINVIKKPGDESEGENQVAALLEKLEIKNHKINFNSRVDSYDVKVADDVTTLEITAVAAEEDSTVQIKGNSDLKDKSKIEIVVTAVDGTQKTYTINVIKGSSKSLKLILTILELLALLLLIILCIILISKHNKKGKKSKKKVENDIPDIQTKTEVIENTIEVDPEKIKKHTRSEMYLEKTIRFRRVCPSCGSINVLTNDKCYMCGEKLGNEDEE